MGAQPAGGEGTEPETTRHTAMHWTTEFFVPLGLLAGIGLLALFFYWFAIDPDVAIRRVFEGGVATAVVAVVGVVIALRQMRVQREVATAQMRASAESARRSDWWNHYQWVAERVWPSSNVASQLPAKVALASLTELIATAPAPFTGVLRDAIAPLAEQTLRPKQHAAKMASPDDGRALFAHSWIAPLRGAPRGAAEDWLRSEPGLPWEWESHADPTADSLSSSSVEDAIRTLEANGLDTPAIRAVALERQVANALDGIGASEGWWIRRRGIADFEVARVEGDDLQIPSDDAWVGVEVIAQPVRQKSDKLIRIRAEYHGKLVVVTNNESSSLTELGFPVVIWRGDGDGEARALRDAIAGLL